MTCKQSSILNNNSQDADIEKASPLIKQFLNIKKEHQNHVLLFRMGDFYETFFEDAILAANVLEITLTARDGGGLGKIPLAGIPCKALDSYMPKLLLKGHKVAVVEQVEDPALAKGIVDRQVVKIITAGTITEPYLLQAKKNNYLAAIIEDKKSKNNYGLAYVDVSTGEFKITEIDEKQLLVELNRVDPSELLVPSKKIKPNEFQVVAEDVPDVPDTVSRIIQDRFSVTLRPNYCFNLSDGKDDIKRVFKVSSLESFGCEDFPQATMAAAAIVDYLEETQKQDLPSFDVISPYSISKYVSIDNTTRRNLELTKTARDGAYKGSLLSSIDRTKTSMGGRQIRQWIEQPLQDIKEIQSRLDTVDEMVNDRQLACDLSDILNKFNDIERISSRISNNSANAKELVALKESLRILPELAGIVEQASSPYLKTLSYVPDSVLEAANLIEKTLKDDPSASVKDGNVIREGYDEVLDEYRVILHGGQDWIKQFEQNEKETTGIKSLKVNFNKTFGYYIEVTHANVNLIPETYIRKQTLINAERYITPDLKEYENKVLNAQTKVTDLEYKLFVDLREELKNYIGKIRSIAKAIAVVDVLLSFSNVAVEYSYVQPDISDNDNIEIFNGRHPVIEQVLPMGSYVPNDLDISSGLNGSTKPQTIILTGPNMAGKSTFMRQIALIVILAQIGCFVPAESAKIGIVDKIFTRVGAVDDLATGQSTFMVEMNETAYILNSATSKSLILLDEIGRGTSTFDGVAIAWAVTEHICQSIGAKTIFATHYHELNVMEKNFTQVANYRITVSETNGEIQFLHKVIPGGASRSYGIQVAKMAGLPSSLIGRAEILMERLLRDEKAYITAKKKLQQQDDSPQLSLFGEKLYT